jgi:hypothetical protein
VVDVRLELPPGGDLDDAEGEARRVGGAREELDVADAVALAGRDDDGLRVHCSILAEPLDVGQGCDIAPADYG